MPVTWQPPQQLTKEAGGGSQQQLEAGLSGHPDAVAAGVVTIGFFWRVWLAHATFFTTDEAWHYFVANQNSLAQAYKTSLTLYHPPLLVFIVYFWRALGTSNLVLRLPPVIAGTLFCYVFYKWLTRILGRTVGWVGLVLVTFLPPLIALSADLRQYTLMLLFSVSAAYFLEDALARNSANRMLLSSICLYLAMLSHYSAFLFGAVLGAYCLLRIFTEPVPIGVIAAWGAGQAGGLGLSCFLYVTQVANLGAVYPRVHPLHRVADWYLSDWYFQPSRDHLLPFLYHGTFGVFRFAFGQTKVGDVVTVMFAAGVVLLLGQKPGSEARPGTRAKGILLLLPFVLNSAAVVAGLYPYGRTRQCVFLVVFGIAGVSVFLARVAKQRTGLAVALAVGIVALCQIFGTLQGRDMLPLADQRHENLDHALDFIRHEVSPEDVVFTDRSTSFQFGHYLCQQKPIAIDYSIADFESFRCNGVRIISAGPNASEFTTGTFASKCQQLVRDYGVAPRDRVWVIQAGWAGELGGVLRSFPEFSRLESHSFGHYINIFGIAAGQLVATTDQR